jgi:hypothetical protein
MKKKRTLNKDIVDINQKENRLIEEEDLIDNLNIEKK